MKQDIVASRISLKPVAESVPSTDLVAKSVKMYTEAVSFYSACFGEHYKELLVSYSKSLELIEKLSAAFVRADEIWKEKTAISKVKPISLHSKLYGDNNRQRMENLDLIHNLKAQLLEQKEIRRVLRVLH